MSQHILVSQTTDGIQVAFTEPVLVPGTTGNRMHLSIEDATRLRFHLNEVLDSYYRNENMLQGHSPSMFRQGEAIGARELSPNRPYPTEPEEPKHEHP